MKRKTRQKCCVKSSAKCEPNKPSARVSDFQANVHSKRPRVLIFVREREYRNCQQKRKGAKASAKDIHFIIKIMKGASGMLRRHERIS